MTDRQQESRAKSIAIHGLTAGLAGDTDGMHQAIAVLADEFGERGIQAAIVFWCDSLIVHVGGHGKDKDGLELTFREIESGEAGTADSVTPEAAWAGRVIAARQLLDKDQFEALMSVLPLAGPDDAHEYVFVLLSITSLTLSVHMAEVHGAGEAPPNRRNPAGWPDPPAGQSWN